MLCWSCQREAGSGAFCVACGALQPANDAADAFAVLGLPSALRRRSGGGRGGVQGAVAPGAPRSLRDRRPARAARVAGAHRPAERGVADAAGSGAAGRVPAGARWHAHRRRRQEVDRRRRDDERTAEVPAPPALLMEMIELREELRAARRAGDAVKVACMARRRSRGRAAQSMAGDRRGAGLAASARRLEKRGAVVHGDALLPALPGRGRWPTRGGGHGS